MSIFSNIFGTTKNIVVTFGTKLLDLGIPKNGVTGDPAQIGTVYTCCSVLSNNLSRMPLSVFLDSGDTIKEMARHRLTYLLKFRPNNYMNAQQFWSTLEFHRSKYGNALARINKNRVTAYPESFDIIHPSRIADAYIEKGELYYVIYTDEMATQTETISAWDMLHFRGLSENGIWGLAPLKAIERQSNINERATSTMDNFYKNNATSPIALESELPANLTGPAKQVLESTREDFQKNYQGPGNAGKPLYLPVGTKLKSVAMQFADAQLIETLKFTREDISAAYHVPLFMVDGSAEKLDVEQLTTLFKNNTMGPITAIYMAEINGKLLTRDELATGFSVMFDVLSLVGMDYQTLVAGIKDQVVNGLMTPNEGAKKLRNKPIEGEWGNRHYMQAQYIALELYDKMNPLLKDDPRLKTNNN